MNSLTRVPITESNSVTYWPIDGWDYKGWEIHTDPHDHKRKPFALRDGGRSSTIVEPSQSLAQDKHWDCDVENGVFYWLIPSPITNGGGEA